MLDPLAEELSSYAPQGEGDELEDLLADEVAADIALEDLTPLRGGTHHGSPGMFEGSPHPSIAAAAAPAPQKHETHCFLVVYWPGHEQHTFTNDHFALGDQLDEDTLWGQFRDAPSSNAAFKLLMKYAPREFFVNGATLMKNKQLQLAMQRTKTTVPIRPLSSFSLPALNLYEGKSILLCGESCVGKTCYAEAHGRFPYYMKTLDQLKDIPGECDLLLFDDMRFDELGLGLTPEEMIALLDVERETSIKCRHFDGRIPPIPRIFTSNLNPDGVRREKIFPEGANRAQQDAINRRFAQPYPYITAKLY